MRFFSALILSLWWAIPQIDAQQVRFIKEDITVTIDQHYAELVGEYTFFNPNSYSQSVLVQYPFKINQYLNYPETIEVYCNEEYKGYLYSKGDEAVFFTISIPPGESRVYEISYKQQTPFNHFEYILTTTSAWGRALDTSIISIEVPDTIELAQTSYPFEFFHADNNCNLYRSIFKQFKPDRDLIIDWVRGTK
jgi:hypothetical protein